MVQKTKNERIRGEDTGCLNSEFLSKLERLFEEDPKRAEVLIYIMICKLDWLYDKGFRESRGHTRHDEMINRQWEDWTYSLFYLARQLERFGVTLVYTKDGKDISTCNSESYLKWKNFWHNYVETLDSATWEEFEAAVYYGDPTPYMPAKAWNED